MRVGVGVSFLIFRVCVLVVRRVLMLNYRIKLLSRICHVSIVSLDLYNPFHLRRKWLAPVFRGQKIDL